MAETMHMPGATISGFMRPSSVGPWLLNELTEPFSVPRFSSMGTPPSVVYSFFVCQQPTEMMPRPVPPSSEQVECVSPSVQPVFPAALNSV